jgi:hypothetical protein
MRKLLMTAAALLALVTTASAGTVKLPTEYLGIWCVANVNANADGGPYLTHQRSGCDNGDKEDTAVRPDSLDYYGGKCRLAKSERSRPYGNGATTFIMSYNCNTGKLTAELYVKNDFLFVQIKRH